MILLKSKKLRVFLIKIFNWLFNFSYNGLSALATLDNDGFHPKHEILRYHEFFRSHVNKNDAVLDIGCGNGFNSYQVSLKAKKVIGIDFETAKITFANSHFHRHNLRFMVCDATKYDFGAKFDKLILSNVLEHIEKRVIFLKKLRHISNTLLLRVPLISRDWLPVYIKSLGMEYRLDKTHFIEYTFTTFQKELADAGWRLSEWSIQFGELWGVAKSN